MHELIIILAKYFIIFTPLLAMYVWLKLPTKSQKKQFIAQAIIGGLIAIILLELGKHSFYNARPFVAGHFTPFFAHGNDNGFPSEHALLAFFVAFLAYKYNTKAAYALLGLAILISAARVLAGVHHGIDIFGSILFSGLAVYISQKVVHHQSVRSYLTHESPRSIHRDKQ